MAVTCSVVVQMTSFYGLAFCIGGMIVRLSLPLLHAQVVMPLLALSSVDCILASACKACHQAEHYPPPPSI